MFLHVAYYINENVKREREREGVENICDYTYFRANYKHLWNFETLVNESRMTHQFDL